LERAHPTGPRPIGDAIRQFFRESPVYRPAAHERVLDAWSEAAGPEWERRATPVAFRAGTLTVEVESSVVLHELRNFRGESYRARANASLGQDRIRKVVFKLRG